MKTRIIQTKFWADGYVASLTPLEKIIFLYYLTNEKVNIIHCYECPDRYVLIDTGVSREVLQRCKDKLQESNKVLFYKDYVLLVNADKYEAYKGEDNEKAIKKLESEMSNDVLDWYINKNKTPLKTPDTGVYTPPINNKSEIISHKEGIVKGNKPLEVFLEEFNKKFGTKYQETDGRKDKIKQRLKKYSLEDLLTAVKNCASMSFYQGENDTGWRADPDYLLRNDEQIDKFLNKNGKKKVREGYTESGYKIIS